MNTIITIKVVQKDEGTTFILNKIEEAFSEFDRIVKRYTRFNENSELSNLNRQSGDWVQVSDEFIYLINYMLNMSNLTKGIFDPTIIDFLEIYGYDKNYDFSKLNNPELDKIILKTVNERPSWKDIKVDIKNNKVKLVKNQRLDLGGIGKGYAIDCAYSKLNDLNNFLIDAGGDIRVKGKNESEELWHIALKNKKANEELEIIGEVHLDNESLACSGSWARKVKQFHHLINPKTGKPENIFRTVYVQTKTAIEADSWATTLFIGGINIGKVLPNNLKYFTINF